MRLADLTYVALKTPIGHLSLGFWRAQLAYVGTTKMNAYTQPDQDIHHRAKRQLQEYFYEGRRTFDLPLLWSGTPFQERAWTVLSSIPYGTTLSYKEQALRMGHPKAQRAVGGANGKNALMIVVPCHRVISSNGTLGGFSSGAELKSWLLTHERALMG